MNEKLHPDLRIEAGIATAVGLIVFSAGSLFAVAAMVLTGISTGMLQEFISIGPLPPILGVFVIGPCFLVAFVLLYLSRHLVIVFPRWLRRASWLIAHTQPRNMALRFQDTTEMPGKYIELFEEGREGNRPADLYVEIRSPEMKIKELQPGMVQVFREPQPDGIVVIAPQGAILWGFRQEKAFGMNR